MVRGVVGGREFDLTKDDVIRRMSDVEPEPVREHFVVIGEKPFPPKQVLAQVTGWDRQTFTTMEAIRVLSRIGFVCQRRVDGRPVWVPEDPEGSRGQGTSPVNRRLAAVESAVAVMQEAIASLTRRVHELERKGRV
jgi:hypothetical protein